MVSKLSVVIPVFNEEENLLPLYEELYKALHELELQWEVLFVDDGSQDGSLQVLFDLADKNPGVKVVSLRRNFGQTAAMAAGFSYATGDVVVPMDGDRQNDPNDIGRLLDRINEGYDVASGWRRDRQDKMLSRRLPSMIANRIISVITGVSLHDYGCTLKAYRAEVLKKVNLYGELHRFVPALAYQYGAKVSEVVVNHRSRVAGVSKYGIDRTLRVILDLLTVKFLLAYSTRPLQLFGKWGFVAMAFGGISGLTALSMKFLEGFHLNRNPLTVLTAFLIFTGIQLIALGLLGELTTRTYHESQGRPVYFIDKTRNIDT